MTVMDIWHMCVRVSDLMMPMTVAVWTMRHRIMNMIVMPIVMVVCVFMLQCFMLMFVLM